MSFGEFLHGILGENSKAFAKETRSLAVLADNSVQLGMAANAKNFISSIYTSQNTTDYIKALEKAGLDQGISNSLKEASKTLSKEGVTQDILENLHFAAKIASENPGIDSTLLKSAGQDFVDAYSKYKTYMADQSIENAEKFLGREGKGLGIGNTINAFFKDKQYGGMRFKTGLGAYAIGAIGMRYLSGGDLTHNARGERDIAGIPFV